MNELVAKAGTEDSLVNLYEATTKARDGAVCIGSSLLHYVDTGKYERKTCDDGDGLPVEVPMRVGFGLPARFEHLVMVACRYMFKKEAAVIPDVVQAKTKFIRHHVLGSGNAMALSEEVHFRFGDYPEVIAARLALFEGKRFEFTMCDACDV